MCSVRVNIRNHYLYLPYGVSTGPGSFQRLIVQLLSGLKGVVVYIDNIYIAGNTLAETNERLRSVLESIAEAELKLKINKCKFFKQSLKVFGYHVSIEGIQLIKDNIKPLL